VLEVGSGGGATAAGAGAGSVPDFGQVPEHDSGIVARASAGRSRVTGTGKGEAGRAGTAGFRRLTGRAQPCPTAGPCWSVTVMHQVDRGLRAVAVARSRARSGSPTAALNLRGFAPSTTLHHIRRAALENR